MGELTTGHVQAMRQKALFGGHVEREDVTALCNEVLRARLQPRRADQARAWTEGLRAAHKALGGPFIWFAPDNPYEDDDPAPAPVRAETNHAEEVGGE